MMQSDMFDNTFSPAMPAMRGRITMRMTALLFAALLLAMPLTTHATTVQVDGGQTSIVFGNGALASLGLMVTSVTPNIVGDLGPNSGAFGINPRNAIGDALDTTFVYDSDAFVPFSGTIEHSGRIQFNFSVEVGDFTIRFDDSRPSGTSGFVVESTYGVEAILFDIANPIVETFENSLVISADILVSPELADFLQNDNFAGVDAGAALVVASASPIPVPAAVWLFGSGLIGLVGIARRRKTA
jgi:hypothetical protein